MGDTPRSRYQRNDKVRLKYSPQEAGIIWEEPLYSGGDWQYDVFFSATDRRYIKESDLVDFEQQIEVLEFEGFLRQIALLKLEQPGAQNLFSLYGSRTEFEVYQFKPALKFLSSPDQRLLIADEVGLGKTIEAGIIFLELQARLDVARVLVICPSRLRKKWQDEMRSRFDEVFEIMDSHRFGRFLNDFSLHGGNTKLKGIVSLESIRRREIMEDLANLHIQFDLVIVDEAHHCRNSATLSHQVVSIISDNADAMLLLTATPLHLGNRDLFNLLHILSPGEFDDYEAFGIRLDPNRYVNRASQYLGAGKPVQAKKELQEVERTLDRQRFVGNPYYQELMETLRPDMNREQMVKAQKKLLELNTLADIFTRTRKRDVQVRAAVRRPITLIVSFTDKEQQFYDSVIKYVRDEYRMTHSYGWVSGWTTIMRERQVASRITAMRNYYSEALTSGMRITSEDEESIYDLMPDNEDTADSYSPDIKDDIWANLLRSAQAIGNTDTKYDVFRHALGEVLSERPNTKILVFSFFRGTLDYLHQRLLREGFSVRKMHGGTDVVERQGIVEEFRDNPDINILLSSEVGAEGLDFQFCSTLFNYDLPWNPMKVEQRIGRLDRFGQKHETILIYNLVIENSIEERIFMRLYDRIGIFKESVGDLEAILGEEIRELSKQIFMSGLTQDEERQLAEQAATNVVRRKQELDDFEEQRLQFMGQEAIFTSHIEKAIETGRFISEAERHALVSSFLAKKFPRSYLERNGPESRTYSLYPDHDFYEFMDAYVFRGKRADRTAQEFLKKLRPTKEIPTTFNHDVAYERKLVEFFTLRHPVVTAALDFWKQQPIPSMPLAAIHLRCDAQYVGRYFFFLFSYKLKGLEDKSSLEALVFSQQTSEFEPEISELFFSLVQRGEAVDIDGQDHEELYSETFSESKRAAQRLAVSERNRREHELRRSNDALVNARLAAVEQTYRIKHRNVQRSLDKATDEKIRRMRASQLDNIDTKFTVSRQDIEAQRQILVSFSMPLAGSFTIVD